MINRRLLRIKVLQELYAYNKSEDKTIEKSEKELFHSIHKSYQLYHYLFLLIVDVAAFARKKVEMAMEKKMPTHEDLHPNTRFIDNKVVKQVENSEQLKKFLNENRLSWVNHPELIKGLYQSLTGSEIYGKYMTNPKSGYEEDKQLVIDFFNHIVIPYEDLYNVLEEESIFWNDEVDYVIGMITKTIKKFRPEDQTNASMMVLYKNDDDRDFVKTLFRKTILNQKEYISLIEKFTKNWDFERIAYMDTLLMKTAIAELLSFPSIPTKVTLNEYIEISKFYSTKKSNVFINGILDKIIHHLRENNKIQKQGRGLIGES